MLRRLPARHPHHRAPRTTPPRRAAGPDRDTATAGATPASPPTPAPGSTPGSTPATAPTPASKTASACGKDTGLGRFPSRQFAINAAWLTCALTAIDLLAWTQTILLHDDPALARAEPKNAALPAAARRRPTRPRRPQTPPQDRPHLALGARTRPRVPPTARAAHPRDLT